MKITKGNYEIYFIDYFDGTLSEEKKNDLFIFLDKNPKLKQEFKEFQNLNLSEIESNDLNNNKLNLFSFKKETLINSSNEEDFFIGYIENDLSEKEKLEFEFYLSINKEANKKLDSYLKTISEPPFIPYPNKKELKKSERKPIYYFVTLLAAACIFAFVVVPYFNNISPNGITDSPEIVKNNTVNSIENMDKEKIINPEIVIPEIEKQPNNEKKETEAIESLKIRKITTKNNFIAEKPKNSSKNSFIKQNIEVKKYINSFEKLNHPNMDLALVTSSELKNIVPLPVPKTDIDKMERQDELSSIKTYTLLGFMKQKTTSFFKKKTGIDISTIEKRKTLKEAVKSKIEEKTGFKEKQNLANKMLKNRRLILFSKK